MEIGTQIKQRRTAAGLSQEELAEQVFVTRQTLSNWENNKTYPDINSLLRLSAVFYVSLDELVKGDIPKMKEQINKEDIRKFNRESNIFTALFLLMILSVVPLVAWNRVIGTVIWLCICVVAMVSAFRVEKLKKQHNIQTYREIVAFTKGQRLDELEQARESGKRPYQKVLLTLGSALLGMIAAWILIAVTQ
ncbi:MAG: helix-turn-helix domain-containing protein [Oscillospiraceae bacterium]|nr:helix-turn-helix domain-containing protein [Oscillospiraceae bacterium]